MKYLFCAVLIMASQAGAAVYTEFDFRYDTAPAGSLAYSGPGPVPDTLSQSLGLAFSFNFMMQFNGILNAPPDGTFTFSQDDDDAQFSAATDPFGQPYEIYDLELTFFGGSIVAWEGYLVSTPSYDGLYIDSSLYDTFRPFVYDELNTIAPGSWTASPAGQLCFSDDVAGPISCSGPPPPAPSPVPLPAMFPVLAMAVFALGWIGRQRRSPTA